MSTEAAAPVPSSSATTPSKAKKAKPASKAAGAKKATPTHPPISEMVPAAIVALKERGGSSGQAIKKYIAGNYKVDIDRLGPFIKVRLPPSLLCLATHFPSFSLLLLPLLLSRST